MVDCFLGADESCHILCLSTDGKDLWRLFVSFLKFCQKQYPAGCAVLKRSRGRRLARDKRQLGAPKTRRLLTQTLSHTDMSKHSDTS